MELLEIVDSVWRCRPSGMELSRADLLLSMVDAEAPLPVVASGGIADGRGLAATALALALALALDAPAVPLATRFLCSDESRAVYKDRVVEATAADTYYTKLFDIEWPDVAHRVLRNRIVDERLAVESPASGQRNGEGELTGKMPVGGETIELPRCSRRRQRPGRRGCRGGPGARDQGAIPTAARWEPKARDRLTTVFGEPATTPAWRTSPPRGVVSSSDRAINPDVERFGYQRAGATGVELGPSPVVVLSAPRRSPTSSASPSARPTADVPQGSPFLSCVIRTTVISV
ncbi:nitronate monooxygenase [Actinomycetospora cinnamomea]|uniref:Nitronate monooxygenase n=1 Tax=Actinomycetospora cinnamomea TaxID=663609 RepID=A0A2U1F7K0_9PSEU|nr:nitronate monooxygenase [Actinomycetospora cinnamomea]PVZ08165.1 nitronate monooxygenase [Actinomycetospora cinnamomea]